MQNASDKSTNFAFVRRVFINPKTVNYFFLSATLTETLINS